MHIYPRLSAINSEMIAGAAQASSFILSNVPIYLSICVRMLVRKVYSFG